MTVEGDHVYHVSTLGVLAHNENCVDGLIGAAARSRSKVRPGQLREASHLETGHKPGHVKSKHGWDVSHPIIQDIRNNPDRVYVSTNAKNRVVIFWKDGDVVITELNTTSVRTAYGKSALKDPKYKPDTWLSNPNYLAVE